MSTGPPPDPEAVVRVLPVGPGRAGIEHVEALLGGASNEIWAVRTGGGEDLVLRRIARPTIDGLSMTVQAAAMAAAGAAGVPVPQVHAAGDDDATLGAYLVMDRVCGETIPRRVLRDPELRGARDRFAADAGTVLARLHDADVGPVPGLAQPDPLALVAERLAALGAPSATFEWALRSLGRDRPAARAPVLVHGDFRLGNLVMDPQGIAAVLDWEGAHLGDPVEDLGWLCTPTWRFGGTAPVAGLGSREDLLAAYDAASGTRPVTVEELAWWERFGSLRWGVICLEQARRHFDGPPSVELAAIGRRVAEVEWDLLEVLG